MSMENPFRANERLREERLRRGWSQQKLADELGIAVVTVNRWERGKQQPTGYYRLKLSALFEKSEAELGLGEEATDTEAANYVEEQFESERETVPVSQAHLEDMAKDSSPLHDPVPHGPAMEREASRLSSSSAYARPDIPFLYRRKRTLLLPITLVLLVIATPITFFLIRSATQKPAALRKSVAAVRYTGPSQRAHAFVTPPAPKTLFFYDPLTKEDNISQWQAGGEICEFADNALHINSNGPGYCSANARSFSDMKFQVTMSIQQGTWSGISFRADSDSNLYYFSISVNGQYEVDKLKHKVEPTKLLSGKNSVIKAGDNKVNILAVEANKSQLSFWINGIMIGQTNDSSFTDGYVGICTSTYTDSDAQDTVEATYTDAYVWTL